MALPWLLLLDADGGRGRGGHGGAGRGVVGVIVVVIVAVAPHARYVACAGTGGGVHDRAISGGAGGSDTGGGGGEVVVLVVVHPDLEHLAPHADLVAEALQRAVVVAVDAPPLLLGELAHPLLLLGGELGAEPLPPAAPAGGEAEVPGPRRRLRPGAHVPGRGGIRQREVRRRHRRGREERLQRGDVVVLRRRGRRRAEEDGRGRAAVEAAVAPARGALERVRRVRHELAAPVERLAAHGRRVVAHALLVLASARAAASLVGHQAQVLHHVPTASRRVLAARTPSGSLAPARACCLTVFSSPSAERRSRSLAAAVELAVAAGPTRRAGGGFIRACRRCQHIPGTQHGD
jgi:hypothetical protein